MLDIIAFISNLKHANWEETSIRCFQNLVAIIPVLPFKIVY